VKSTVVLSISLLAAGALSAAPRAAPHGGVYRGPGTGVGPGGSAPTTPAPSGGGNELCDWSVWWSFNRDPFLELKEAVQRAGTTTGSEDFYLGQGQQILAARPGRPAAEVVRARVVPALLAALAGQRDEDLVTACLMALAKIGLEPAAGEERVGSLLRSYLSSTNQAIAETAALALGVLARQDSAPTLAALLGDTARGRELVERRKVPYRTRAIAAYGLALVGYRSAREDVRRFVVHHLTQALEHDDTASADLAVACVHSLGLVRLEVSVPEDGVSSAPEAEGRSPTFSRAAQVRWLLGWFADRRRSDLVRAYAPLTLAKLSLGAGAAPKAAVGEALLAVVREHGDEAQDVRRGATAALGLLGDDDEDPLDARVRAELTRLAADHDALVRGLARISLARTAARRGAAEEGAALTEARRFLLRDLARGSRDDRSWSALALGVLEHRRLRDGGAPSADVRAALRTALAGTRSPRDSAALCVAIGLSGDPGAAGALLERLQSGAAEGVRAQAAVALGMVGAHEAKEPLRALVRASVARPGLMREAAAGLGLLGERELVTELVAALRAADVLAEQSAIAASLGFIGDQRAIEPLLELLGDTRVVRTARAFAAAALGIVCDKEPLPWNSKLAVDVYYGQPPATLTDSLGARGVLDLL